MKPEEVTEWKHTTDDVLATKLIKEKGFKTYKVISSRIKTNEVEQSGPCYVLGRVE